MNARFVSLLLVVAASVFPVHAGELPDYIRFAEDAQSARLEIAIKTFTLPSGKKVDLIGVVHIADDAYYQELNRRFAGYDTVLFELVGDPKRLTESAPPTPQQSNTERRGSTLSSIQQAAGQYLHLTFQLDAIDYTRKNMVHADATAEQFESMQAQRGETTVSLFARALQAQLYMQMNGQMDRSAMGELDTFALIRILMSRDSAAEFKKTLAKSFGQMESLTAAIEGKDGTAIVSGRNQVVVNKIREVLAHKNQRHIAVFFGGAHMPGIESLLIGDLKATPSGEEWLAAWTMPKPQPVKSTQP
jgi:hypothetical protein